MQLSANSLIGVSASGGKLLWRYDRVRGSRFRGACHQCVLRDTREMAIIDSNCPRLPAMPHRVGLCRSPGNTTLCHQKRYTPSRSASQAGRREFESPRPLYPEPVEGSTPGRDTSRLLASCFANYTNIKALRERSLSSADLPPVDNRDIPCPSWTAFRHRVGHPFWQKTPREHRVGHRCGPRHPPRRRASRPP